MSATAQFCNNTSFHGFPDLYGAGTKGRIFWATVLFGFSAICAYQMVKLGIDYHNDDVGTSTKTIMPDTMPVAIVCPVDWVNSEPEDGDDTTKEQWLSRQKYLNGYLPMYMSKFLMAATAAADVPSWDQDDFKAAKTWLASETSKGNGIREIILGEINQTAKMVEESSMSMLIPHLSCLEWKTQLNWHGPCIRYGIGNKTVSRLQMQLAGMVIGQYDVQNNNGRFIFSLTGKLDPNPLVFPRFEFLDYGYDYTVKFRPLIIDRMNKRFEPCKKWTASDRLACIVRAGNQLCRKGVRASQLSVEPEGAGNKCITYVPPTPAYPVEESGQAFCNLFDLLGPESVNNLCVMDTLGAEAGRWDKDCPFPCHEEFYQFTLERVERKDGTETATITLQAEAGGGIQVKEYFIITTMGLLSGLGGTMGLWMGASLLSVIQAIYLFTYRRTDVQ